MSLAIEPYQHWTGRPRDFPRAASPPGKKNPEERESRMTIYKIECIIKPFKLEEVKEALTKFGVHGMTIYEVKGFGRQRGHTEIYRGAEYQVDFIPKMKIEILVSEDVLDATVDCVTNAARTDAIGDGKISVLPVETVTRIRTGEKDLDAL